MFRNLLVVIAIFFTLSVSAQMPGDTIVVSTFNYGSATRDSVIQFPSTPGLSYEKVLMLYNMRCKNGLISSGAAGQTNVGCGEWDYSCNTYITDSSRIDSLASTRPSYSITNFSGTTYPYINQAYYNLFQFTQVNTVAMVISENQYQLGSGILSVNNALAANQRSGRSQYLFTQAELSAAGVTTGDINGIILDALNSSSVNFLKVRIKHTGLNALNAATPETSGFSETFYANQSFLAGANRLQFHTAFNWDGVSNIIIDLSFTNSTPNAILNLAGTTTPAIYGLYASNGTFINTTGGVSAVAPAAPFSSVNNQITVSFWSRGNSGIGNKATSIIEGVDNSMNRQLNIHHPWDNSNVYFDCGNLGSGYDRINKLATAAEIEGDWNHWAFTKNATTGIMNIYLNGTLWHTGTGKTNPISIDSLIFGANINKGNQYQGDMDELSVWNAELSQTDIQAWMNKEITASHPNYSNLVAYYKLNEGNGINSADASVNALTADFTFVPDWKFTRGDQLSRFFTETTERPNTIFLQGNYTILNTNVNVLDSVVASANIVREYAVVSNAGTFQSDAYNVISTNAYWLASYRYLYDGVTGSLIDSFAVTPTSTLVITNLPYIERSPSKYEIMSFVTPYGINLDLGMTGKTWTFDMTDYLPILKGAKRMSIERGGQWQENMDIKFLFIVGTPPHEVKDITQLWRQPGNSNYNDIITDRYFEPRDVLLDASATSFKIRNTITGHGQEGEFLQRDHTFNIGGGADEFVWTVIKKCGANPVYPQGGTWIYDRCGWCPGMASDLKELDITPYVTPGTVANLDYHMVPTSSPAIGNSNYIVTNQLVSYGPMNFTLDVAVEDIMAPTKKIEYFRGQSICANPKIIIQNTGSTSLTALRIEYWINNNTTRSVYNWSGNLAPMQKEEVSLSNSNLWVNVVSAENEFHVELKNPNGSADQYIHNNFMNSQFVITDVVPSNFIVHHRSNNFASETSYQLTDESGNILLSRSGLANNTNYRDTMNLTYGCYKFLMTDTDEDGISFWANSDGAGLIRFLKGNGTVLKTFNPDFGATVEYNFTIDFPLSYEDLVEMNEVKLYPNPANDQFAIEGIGMEKATVTLSNSIGQVIKVPVSISTGKMIFNTGSLPGGVYIATIVRNGKKSSRKVVVE